MCSAISTIKSSAHDCFVHVMSTIVNTENNIISNIHTALNKGMSSKLKKIKERRLKRKSVATIPKAAEPTAVGEDICSTSSCEESVEDPLNVLKNDSEPRIPRLEDIVAIDCEFVGVGHGKTSALGRVSIVDAWGKVVLDLYGSPDTRITDYRTCWSGLRPEDICKGLPLEAIQRHVCKAIKGRVLVGHSVGGDLKVLQLKHPRANIRDTSRCEFLRSRGQSELRQYGPVALRHLSAVLLGNTIQSGEHCSVEDATATMALYRLVREEWEQSLLVENGGLSAKRRRCDSLNQVLPEGYVDTRKSECEKSLLDDDFWPDNF